MAEDTAKTNWPVFRSLASFRASDLPGDLIAGLTLAAIAIPEQMATARLGGFSPQIGFFAFIAGSLGFAALGSNRFLSCGADSTITPIFAGGLVLVAAAGSPGYQAHAMALALLVGAILIIVVWALTGPIFRYSDTWQLVINTGTTIITFLMVFLIQNTQNRDARAINLKLDELIHAIDTAQNQMMDIEKLSDEELDVIHDKYSQIRADCDDDEGEAKA